MKGTLDTINTNPVYTETIPSTGKSFEFRGYSAGEEQALLVAKESKDVKLIIQNVKSIIHKCSFEKIDPETLAAFDIEYLLLALRKVSVGEEADVTLKCQKCEGKIDTVVNLNDIKSPKIIKDANIVVLNENLRIIMKYPGFGTLEQMNTKKIDVFSMVASLITQVVNEDNVIETSELDPAEVIRFIKGMNSKVLNKLTEFIHSTPTVTYQHKVKCISCQHNNEYDFKGIHNFFV